MIGADIVEGMAPGLALISLVVTVQAVVGAAAAPGAQPAREVTSSHAVAGSGPAMAGSGPAVAGSGPAVAGPWSWPLAPEPRVERGFDPPDQPWLPGHRGVDLAGVAGQQVLAPEGGRVTFAGQLAGRGVVVVAHPEGLRSTFEPLVPGVAVGDAVVAGDGLGSLAAHPSHCEPGACLHWGVLRGRTYLDPLSFVGRTPIVLLPLG